MREYTAPEVFDQGVREGWAEPTVDPTTIIWPARQAAAAIPFEVIDGRPVNPVEPHLPAGRNELGFWGEQLCADAFVRFWDGERRPWLLMVERVDGHGWALPGGAVDPGEDPVDAAIRELAEETTLQVSKGWDHIEQQPARYVPDPRASREAWMVTVPLVIIVQDSRFPRVEGRDDAKTAAWIRADSYEGLEHNLRTRFEGVVFPAHVAMIRDLLDS